MSGLPWLWLRLPGGRLGIVPDGGVVYFSERYGFVKVWRLCGYKVTWRPGEHKGAPLWFGGWSDEIKF
jgi:hypothetical protein